MEWGVMGGVVMEGSDGERSDGKRCMNRSCFLSSPPPVTCSPVNFAHSELF